MVEAHMQLHQQVSPGYAEFLLEKSKFNYWQQTVRLTVVTQGSTTVTEGDFSRIFPLAREELEALKLWYKTYSFILLGRRPNTPTCQFLVAFWWYAQVSMKSKVFMNS